MSKPNQMLWVLLLSLFAATQAIAMPKVQQQTLDNGLNVLLIEAHHVPMVVMELIMPAGSRFDARQRGGTSALLSGLLMDHTRKHDYQAWASKLDDAAIRLGSATDPDAMTMSLTVLKEALDEGVSAMAEALLQPGWDQARFDFLQQNAISASIKAQEEAATHAAQAVATLLFPNHPYGHPVSGDVTSLKRIKLQDLKLLYRNQVKPVGATLAVSGDITMAELKLLLNNYLAAWQGSPQQRLQDISPPVPAAETAKIITLDKNQALVEWVRLGPSRHDEDYMGALVLNHMLGGGGFGSRLMEEIREKRGLVYGVYAWFQPLQTSGAYTIRLQTRADQVEQAEAVLREVLQGMVDGHFTQLDLDKSKTNLIGGFAQRMDSNRERASLLAMMGFYGRPLNYLQNWTKSVEYVKLADVRRITKKYLQPDDWKRIVVGPEKN